MEKAREFLRDFWPGIGIALTIIVGGLLDMGSITDVPIIIWLALFFVFIQALKPQNELRKLKNSLPKLIISDPGTSHVFFDNDEVYLGFYIDVFSSIADSVDVYPNVGWNHNEWVEPPLITGSKCWWKGTEKSTEIPHPQTMTIKANGQPRRLYLARLNTKTRQLTLWYRDEAGIQGTSIMNGSGTYYVDVTLTSTNGAKANCRLGLTIDESLSDIKKVETETD